MKQFYYLPWLLLALPGISRAQSVGIGTTSPNASARLDVQATNQGVSFPNLSLSSVSDATTVASPVPGLLVYNTNAALPCGKGYYFNNGTAAAPIWACFTKTTQQYHAYNTGGRLGVSASTLTLQPGCSLSIVVPTGQVVDVKVDAVVGARNTSANAGQYSIIDAVIYVDGNFLNQGGYNRILTSNPSAGGANAIGTTALSTWISGLAAGTHTIELRTARTMGTTAVDIGGNSVTDVNAGEIHAVVSYR